MLSLEEKKGLSVSEGLYVEGTVSTISAGWI